MLLSILVTVASFNLGGMTRVALVPLTAPYATTSTTDIRKALPRVRTLDRRLAEILRNSGVQSTTVRHLLEAIERSDVIVYVSVQLTLCNEVEGGLHFVNATGGQRYLRVVVRPGLSRRETSIVIAHELQHAVEVAGATWVRNPESMSALYRRIGRLANSRRYETYDAQQVSLAVRDEMSATAAADRRTCATRPLCRSR